MTRIYSIINSSFLFSPILSRLLVIKWGLRKRELLTMFVYFLFLFFSRNETAQIYLSMSEQEVRKCTRRRECTGRRGGGGINITLVASFLTFYHPFCSTNNEPWVGFVKYGDLLLFSRTIFYRCYLMFYFYRLTICQTSSRPHEWWIFDESWSVIVFAGGGFKKT